MDSFEGPAGQETRNAPSSGTANNSIITLIVGPEKEHITVAQDLLCDKVAFFHNAFEGSFLESQTKTFTFPDDEPENFRCLVEWLKGRSVSSLRLNCTWIWLSKLWIFGNKYHIDELQNEIIDVLHAKFAAYHAGINIAYETLDYIVENTFERSPLRSLFVDMLTNGISLYDLPARVPNIPPEMLQDMFIQLKTAIFLNDPTATSLLTRPVEEYHVSSAHCKATAMPAAHPPASEQATPFHCDGNDCQAEGRPIWDAMYICTHHQLKFCEDCSQSHRGHRLKLISLTTPAYTDNITGPNVTMIDGQINDSGFYCDGPACDPGQDQRTHSQEMLMSGDRYHCLECRNIDYCTLCVRGELRCKDEGHSILRIRPTFAKRNLLGQVGVKVRQEREREGSCWRCGVSGHGAEECDREIRGGHEDVLEEE